MSPKKPKMKTRSSESDEDNEVIIKFLKSAEFCTIIDNIVKVHTIPLLMKVEKLENDIINLTQSNKELVRLCYSEECSKFKKNHDEDFLNISDNSDSSARTIVECKTLETKNHSHDKNSVEPDKSKGNRERHRRRQTISGSDDKKQKMVVGTAVSTCDEGNSFRSQEDTLWIHIDRCKYGVEVEDVNQYLENKCPRKQFIVEKLRKTGNPSFKIGVPKDLEDTVFDESFWPKNIIVKEFQFFRTRRQNRNRSEFSKQFNPRTQFYNRRQTSYGFRTY